MPERPQLEELILLAEKGMGWHGTSIGHDWCGQPTTFTIDCGRFMIGDQHGPPRDWNPRTSFSDAGMLMRALGVIPVPVLLHEVIMGWEGTKYGDGDRGGRFQEGNTEAAQRAAVVECALKILKGRDA